MYYSRVLEKVLPVKRLLEEVKAERRYPKGLVACFTWGPQVECSGVPRLRQDGSIQSETLGLGKLRSYMRDTSGEGHGSQGNLLIIGLLGKSYQDLTFACDSVDCSLGHMPA